MDWWQAIGEECRRLPKSALRADCSSDFVSVEMTMADSITTAESSASRPATSVGERLVADSILPAAHGPDSPTKSLPKSDRRLHVEDLHPGQIWRSPFREVTAEDVRQFALLTGDDDPLHRMPENASSTSASASSESSPFGKPVAHGLLGLSVLAGLGTEFPNAATLALVGITDWQFDHPIYFGDSVRVETTLESIQPHGRRAGRVTWMRRLLSEEGRQLQHGRFITLVATRGRNPRRPK